MLSSPAVTSLLSALPQFNLITVRLLLSITEIIHVFSEYGKQLSIYHPDYGNLFINQVEDVFITGIVAEHARVSRIGMEGRFKSDYNVCIVLEKCKENASLFSHTLVVPLTVAIP